MRYFADTLKIKKFRNLNNETITLSKKITVFAGQNGVGKSNLMSLIAATFGINKKKIGKGKFQPEFSDYFTISNTEDFKQYETFLKVTSSSNSNNFIQKRHSYKDDKQTNRGIRVIPRGSNIFTLDKTVKECNENTKNEFSIGDSARVPMPTIFLSLSRLYPVGETSLTSKKINFKTKGILDESLKKYIEWYNRVLPNSINLTKGSSPYILTKDKISSDGIYVELDHTQESSQSIGQDNLRSIINALIDFYNLKLVDSQNYFGGVLCIDEIDASLHPSAQWRLFNLLKDVSENLNLQIFMTTHSLTILKEIINLSKDEENYKLVYLTDPSQPNVSQVNSYEALKSDLFDERISLEPTVKIYCEDENTEFLFEQLLEAYKEIKGVSSIPKYTIIPVNLGCAQLKSLPDKDDHFHKVGIILDGDSKTGTKNLLFKYINHDETYLNSINERSVHSNVVSLPTFLAPESYMYYIICDLIEDDRFTDFWAELTNVRETLYYTKNRMINDIKQKVNITSQTTNDEIKSASISDTMKKFFQETHAFANYYRKKNTGDLESFHNNITRVITKLSQKIKSTY